MAENSEEKTEAPSQKKRDDARNDGQVAFSREVTASALFGAYLILFYFSGDTMLDAYRESMTYAFINLNIGEFSIPLLQSLFVLFIKSSSVILIPFFISGIVIGIGSSVAQVGFQVTLKPLAPKANKISPAKGLGRMFSKQALNDLLKSIFKMAVIGYIGYYTFIENVDEIITLSQKDSHVLIMNSAWIIGLFMFRLLIAMMVLSTIDYIFQRWDLEQKLKMSHQELKDELKQAEGDPKLKGKIRQIQQQLSQARMMQDVPKADVVISNPTHFAIAMLYDRETMNAPQVVAKGADHIALRIIEIAKENEVFVTQNPTVARALYFQIEIGDSVPEEFYRAVAEILAFVYKSKKRHKK